MDEQIEYIWQQTILDAFLSPPQELPGKIGIALRTISARLKEAHQLDLSEQMALDDGLHALQVLMSEMTSQPHEDNQGERKKIA